MQKRPIKRHACRSRFVVPELLSRVAVRDVFDSGNTGRHVGPTGDELTQVEDGSPLGEGENVSNGPRLHRQLFGQPGREGVEGCELLATDGGSKALKVWVPVAKEGHETSTSRAL